MEKRRIYLDHAATTAVDPRVVEAMLPCWTEFYGNPSSIYVQGREAHKVLDSARGKVASILHCRPDEVVFTGCGTESDNLALRGVSLGQRRKGNHIITTAIEHHAVGHTAEQLQKYFGMEVTYLPVDQYGMVSPDDVAQAIKDTTVLISVMYANNEIGTILPIGEISKVARARGIPFHTDAVQAGGSLDLNVETLGVDLLSLSAHKFYGPKGVGVLYVRKNTPYVSTLTGGGQERNRRAGTENVALAAGLAQALELAYADAEASNKRLAALRDRLIQGVVAAIPDTHVTGHPTQRLANNASFVFEFIEGESILLNLDLNGVAGSSGSACTSASLEPSHVLLSCGLPHEIAHGSLRLTLGKENTDEDVEYVLSILPGIVDRLRQMSPLYRQKKA
ncbi:MAG: cysteine desulfurase NifS [Chloroflexota bacterium]|nr:cysteine desulfurase NifS [Chloroflexota bacterium]